MIAQTQDPKTQTGDYGMVPPPAYPQATAGTPQNSYQPAPQIGTPGQPQYYPQPPLSDAARLGEQYRAELMAACAQGRHDRTTKFGVCGIITAIICFPIGLVALCIDNEERCARCGVRL